MKATLYLTYAGVNVDVEFEAASGDDIKAVIARLTNGSGLEPRKYGKSEKPADKPDYVGVIVEKKATDRKWNDKPFYAYSVKSEGGEVEELQLLDASLRKGDKVKRTKNGKGYPTLILNEVEESDEIPF